MKKNTKQKTKSCKIKNSSKYIKSIRSSREEILLKEKIGNSISVYKKLLSVTNKALDIGAMDISGPLYETIWSSFDILLSLSDEDAWIEWFIYENDLGKKKFDVKLGDKSFIIKNSADLARFLILKKNKEVEVTNTHRDELLASKF